MTPTLEEFLGPPLHAKDTTREVEAAIYQTRMMRMGCGPILHRLDTGSLAICQGFFRKTLDYIDHGPNLVVVVHNDHLVGFNHPGTLYLVPEYRGRGLGPEMLAQLYLLDGLEVWLQRPRKLTTAGRIAHERAYALLLERGLL